MSAVEMTSPTMEQLVDPIAEVERLAGDFGFLEGPVWDMKTGSLLFSDLEHDVRRRYADGEGVTVVAEGTSRTNGMVLDDAGRLIVCEHVSSSLVRFAPDGTREVLASHHDGLELNSPNDVVVRSDGTIWFTDPPYGRISANHGALRPQELSFQGVFRLGAEGLRPVSDDFAKPNGLCFSLDESVLYVADTERVHVRRFDVTADGTLRGGEVFAELEQDAPGLPDGMRLDELGNLWTTGPGGISAYQPDGTRAGRIRVPEVAANLAWGGQDLRNLYITATTGLYRIRTRARGAPLPHLDAYDRSQER